jgi:hypothetical protein
MVLQLAFCTFAAQNYQTNFLKQVQYTNNANYKKIARRLGRNYTSGL